MPKAPNFTQPDDRRAWIRQLQRPLDDTKWNELARQLFAWQFHHVPPYRRLCLARRITPQNLTSWRDIPAVPQQLFKREKLFAHPSTQPAAIYETSGTTTGHPGRQYLLHTDIYRAASVEGARYMGLPSEIDFLHFLVPSPAEAPHSSLSAMFGFWQKEHGVSRARFWMQDHRIDFARLRQTLSAQVKRGHPVGICGTAFSFVHLIDAWAPLPPMRLPNGSWLLETGGFKGRSREISKAELYGQLSRIFAIPDQAIWNEYGMSELSSQAYARGVRGLHQTPPWARVLVCDPTSGWEVDIGRRGLVRWIDLANTDSVMAVQTLDAAKRTAFGFDLMGRLRRTEPRGCSLSTEDLLGSKQLIPEKGRPESTLQEREGSFSMARQMRLATKKLAVFT